MVECAIVSWEGSIPEGGAASSSVGNVEICREMSEPPNGATRRVAESAGTSVRCEEMRLDSGVASRCSYESNSHVFVTVWRVEDVGCGAKGTLWTFWCHDC